MDTLLNRAEAQMWRLIFCLPPLMVTSPRQLLGTLEAQRLWQLNLQSDCNDVEGNKNQALVRRRSCGLSKRTVTSNGWGLLSRSTCGWRQMSRGDKIFLTFALKALPKEAPEQLLAVLAHGGPGVWVDDERVWHFHLRHQNLVELNWSSNVWLRIRPLLPTNKGLRWWLLLFLQYNKG